MNCTTFVGFFLESDMFSKRYLALAQDENAVEAGSVEQPVAKRRRDITAVPVLCSILLVSLVVNLFSCTTLLSGPWTKSGVTEFGILPLTLSCCLSHH